MKKVYIDEIMKKAADLEPGPDRYNLHNSFGPKVGAHYSFRPNNDPFLY
jgi:hypothetical protein